MWAPRPETQDATTCISEMVKWFIQAMRGVTSPSCAVLTRSYIERRPTTTKNTPKTRTPRQKIHLLTNNPARKPLEDHNQEETLAKK